jgi:hypothetical protein
MPIRTVPWRVRSHERGDRLRIRVDQSLLHDLPRLVHHANRCLLQRYVQPNVVFHCRSPSLRGHMRLASYVPEELIPCTFVWLDPGITPCCKTHWRSSWGVILFP